MIVLGQSDYSGKKKSPKKIAVSSANSIKWVL